MSAAAPEVVIIGSGPAGVSAAWPLVEAGCRVLMLEATTGRVPEPDPERPSLRELRRDAGGWRHLLGDDLRGLRMMTEVSPKLRMIPDAAFLERYQRANHLEPDGFAAIGILARGGLSNFWGAVAGAYDAGDLAGWPIGPDDLAPAYRAVARRIGISGTEDDDMAAAHGLGLPLQPPLPLSPLAERVLERYHRQRGSLSLRLGRNRSAVLTQPLDGRRDCSLSGACMWGCARGAVYSATADLERLRAHSAFTLREGFLVTALSTTGDSYLIEGRDSRSGAPLQLTAPRVVLAAGALPSTRLALQCLGRYDEALPLQNCPALALALAVPAHLGRGLPETGFGMAQLAFEETIGESGDIAHGLLYGAEAMAAPDLSAHMPLTRPGARALLRSLLPALLIGLVYLPGRYSANRVRLHRGAEPSSDRLEITGGVSPEHAAAYQALVARLTRTFRRLGAYLLPGSAKPYPPGAEIHYGASLPMGGITSAAAEIIGRPGLFVADGASLPGLAAKHHTFTVMANAHRLGAGLASRLRPRP